MEPQKPPLEARLGFVLALFVGFLRSRQMRRLAMFYVTLAALGMLFLGATVLDRALSSSVWVFLAYWLLCGWLTLLAVVLAVYDLVRLRLEGVEERRGLRARLAQALSEEMGRSDGEGSKEDDPPASKS